MERLGRYEVGDVLGEGGAGTVYDAVLVGPGGLRKPVALKVLRQGDETLRREARIGGLLRHPNLVDVFEVGEEGGEWFCALERCTGALSAHLPLPPRAAVEVGLQVCAALHYAHEALGLVHLDLKPANLLLSEDGLVKVADLGIARAEGFDDDGRIRGTPGYMSPEQALGGELDARADIHALGVTLVELVTGSRPMASETVDWLGESTLESTLEILPEYPDWLAPVVERCVAPDPEDRWPTMAALAEALRALEVDGPGLREAVGWVAPARTEPAPLEATPLLGREPELAQLAETLRAPCLLTLKGPAGIGKTRLALAAARRFDGPAFLCDLADTTTREGLLHVVARALDVRLGRLDPVAALGHALAARGPLVLVLDNFEQLAELAPVVRAWHEHAPEARILVTSRVALGVGDDLEVGALSEDSAVALLRARARHRGVDAEGPELVALARRLDGLPLALELAAGRLGVLSVRDVLERLDLGLLRGGTGDRHATLRAALDGSWALLSDTERAALAQLSVFAGGFVVEAAEEVLAVDAPILDVLAALEARSMLRTDGGRLGLLKSIQAYAAEQLDDGGAAEVRHGRCYAAQGETDVPAAELDNLVAACRRAVGRGDGEVAAATLARSWAVLALRGPLEAGATLAREVLGMPGLTGPARARAELVAGAADEGSGRLVEARAHYEAALALRRQDGNRGEEGRALRHLAGMCRLEGRLDEAIALCERALALHREAGDRRGEGIVLGHLGGLHLALGRREEARRFYVAALARHREVGNARFEGVALANLGLLHRQGREVEPALACFEAARLAYRRVGDRRLEGDLLKNLGFLLADRGRLDEAWSRLTTAVAALREVGALHGVGLALNGLGTVARRQGRLDEARRHLSEALALFRRVRDPRSEARVLANLGGVFQALGEHAEAERHYDAALALHRAHDSPEAEVAVLSNRGARCLDRGDLDEARALLARAVTRCRDTRNPHQEGDVLLLLARAEADAGAVGAAREHLERAEVLLAPFGDPEPLVELARVRARVDAAR